MIIYIFVIPIYGVLLLYGFGKLMAAYSKSIDKRLIAWFYSLEQYGFISRETREDLVDLLEPAVPQVINDHVTETSLDGCDIRDVVEPVSVEFIENERSYNYSIEPQEKTLDEYSKHTQKTYDDNSELFDQRNHLKFKNVQMVAFINAWFATLSSPQRKLLAEKSPAEQLSFFNELKWEKYACLAGLNGSCVTQSIHYFQSNPKEQAKIRDALINSFTPLSNLQFNECSHDLIQPLIAVDKLLFKAINEGPHQAFRNKLGRYYKRLEMRLDTATDIVAKELGAHEGNIRVSAERVEWMQWLQPDIEPEHAHLAIKNKRPRLKALIYFSRRPLNNLKLNESKLKPLNKLLVRDLVIGIRFLINLRLELRRFRTIIKQFDALYSIEATSS